MPIPSFKEIRDDNFTQEVEQYHGLVLLEFYRDSCSSCRGFEAVVSVVSQYADQIKYVRLNTDTGGTFHYKRLQAKGDPSTFIFYNGKVEGQILGAMPIQYFNPMLEDIFKGMQTRLGISMPNKLGI